MRKEKTLKQINGAFETWQSVCGLKFKMKIDEDEEDELMKIVRVAHAFYPGKSTICGDFHFDAENWTDKKTVPGDGKYSLFSAATHDFGHTLGIFHPNEKDSVTTPFNKHGFSVENKDEIFGERHTKSFKEMHGKPKNVE